MNSADATIQGKRIINKNPDFLAPSHGCVIQNRAIMRKPCGTIHFTLSFSQNSVYLRVRLRERFVNPQLLKQLAVYKIKECFV